MNLADAIRRATTEGSVPFIGEVPPAFQARPAEPNPVSPTEPSANLGTAYSPEPPNQAVLGGNVVRIELFMSAEQTTNMLRAIMVGQHTVLTLAEAAHYLRVRPQTLSKLAEEGEIRGVDIEGKWRFPKHHLDEWLYRTVGQALNEEEQQDVA